MWRDGLLGADRVLLVAVGDAAAGQVVGGELDLHPVSWEDADEIGRASGGERV